MIATTPRSDLASGPALVALAIVALAVVATPAEAQFKVIGADGKVTYTDREPNASEGSGRRARRARHRPSGRARPAVRAAPGRVKYPVTLYVRHGACEPCDVRRASPQAARRSCSASG